MIISNGKNDFINNTFDRYRWSANTYETPEEIYEYFNSLAIKDKEIKSITAIGALLHECQGDLDWCALETLKDAGVIDDYDCSEDSIVFPDGTRKTVSECQGLMENVSLRRSETLFEPVIITFADDSTLELLPCASRGLRIGYNTIPKGMVDGTNHGEFDIGILFNKLVAGKKLRSLQVFGYTKRITYNGPRPDKTLAYNKYRFDLSSGSFRLEEHQGSEYELSSGYIKYKDLTAIKPYSLNGWVILETSYYGGCANIFPVVGTGWDESIADSACPEIISVYRYPRLASPLMQKYFDPNLPINGDSPEGQFDYYFRSIYPKKTVLDMMDEAERELNVIQGLPTEEQYRRLKIYRGDKTEAEKRKAADAEIDFTQRFILISNKKYKMKRRCAIIKKGDDYSDEIHL